ncbi:MAG: type I glyceraldehyde-3-phosphate dehydrogenase [Proteobacteria bacterium]|nr:type I glyceraldehyde-3-phosphate dehydrogenase [Pseudomonadota bacterium]
MSIRIGINGFGRIGRCVFRASIEAKNKDLEVVHINDLSETKTLAHLLKYDSVHGTLDAEITHDENSITVNGRRVTVSKVKSVSDLPWKDKSVDVVFECTGIFTKKSDAEGHLKSGAKSVLISAPATDEDITVVYGVNHEKIDMTKHKIISNASCTTNCLAPFTKVIHDKLGIKRGLMTTIHSYTNDQNILDLPHKDLRRARAAALSMIPTSTGAAKAIGLVMPELKGKLDGLAVRVPTPNVSLVDVTFEVTKPTTAEEVNKMLLEASKGHLKGILGYTEEPLVSVDFNGNNHSSFIDAASTKVVDGTLVKVLSWYDNETGFSWRMLDVARLMAK